MAAYVHLKGSRSSYFPVRESEQVRHCQQEEVPHSGMTEETQKHIRLSTTNTLGSDCTIDEELINYDDILIEEEQLRNPQLVSIYLNDIHHYLLEQQFNNLSSSDYMVGMQDEINPKMRSILIDWIVEVHLKFKLNAHTLYLTINIIDRFLSLNPIKKNKLQLLGVTALFIASKYEEIYPNQLKDYVYICDKAYSKQQILMMEGAILSSIQFNLNYVSPLRILESTLLQQNDDPKIFSSRMFHLASYFMELSLHDYQNLIYTPLIQAQSALFLSNRLLNIGDCSERVDESVLQCAKFMIHLHKTNQHQGQHPAVRRKYCTLEHLQVGLIECPY